MIAGLGNSTLLRRGRQDKGTKGVRFGLGGDEDEHTASVGKDGRGYKASRTDASPQKRAYIARQLLKSPLT